MLFIKQWRKMFSQKAIVEFNEDFFSVVLCNRKIEKKNEYKFSDIISYKTTDSAKDDSSFLKLNFINGSKVYYTFLEQDIDEKQCITWNVCKYIQSYNDTRNDTDRKIILTPNLFATKTGRNYIIGLSILLFTTIIILEVWALGFAS